MTDAAPAEREYLDPDDPPPPLCGCYRRFLEWERREHERYEEKRTAEWRAERLRRAREEVAAADASALSQ